MGGTVFFFGFRIFFFWFWILDLVFLVTIVTVVRAAAVPKGGKCLPKGERVAKQQYSNMFSFFSFLDFFLFVLDFGFGIFGHCCYCC